jgi:hypothetical protein
MACSIGIKSRGSWRCPELGYNLQDAGGEIVLREQFYHLMSANGMGQFVKNGDYCAMSAVHLLAEKYLQIADITD